MLKLKTPLICAGAGFILSFFLGLINGVRFFTILVRAGITGIIFGGFVFVTAFILEKFVPELFSSEFFDDSSFSGGNVNITLDDAQDEGDYVAQAGAFMSDNEESHAPVSDDSMDEEFLSLHDNDAFGSSTESETLEGDDVDSSVMPEITDFGDDTMFASDSELPIDEGKNTVENTKVMAEAIRTILKRDE